MANKSDLGLNERSFGHCIVTWELKNYGRALWQNDLKIETPEFSIKGPYSRVTKWKLKIQSESNHESLVERFKVNIGSRAHEIGFPVPSKECNNADFGSNVGENVKEKFDFKDLDKEQARPNLSIKNLMLHLERAKSDEGPSDIWVDWKVSSIGINGEKFSLIHDGRFFKNKFKYGLNIGTIYDWEKDFEYNFGVMTIICDMVIKDFDVDIGLDGEIDIDLYALSEDLQYIFDQQKFCDAELKVDGKSVMVHKALLCSHSNFFADLFDKADSEVIELSDIKYNEVLGIVRHLYSYDLKYVIGQPSVSIYDSAIRMNFKDLAAHYTPEECKIHSVIDVHKFTFTWIVENFDSVELNCISSPIYSKNVDEAWQIHLFPKGNDCKSEYTAISVECIEGDFPDWCIQCTIVKDNEALNDWKTLKQSNKSLTLVEEEKFIKREDLLKLLKNDSFKVGIKIRAYLGNESSIISKTCAPVLYSLKKSFENMERNMLALRRSNKYADVLFKIGKQEIKAHRYILSARSHLLSGLFEEGNSITLSNISSETLKLVLDYMYSAIFSATDVETIIDAYKAAVEFAIPRLQDKCSRVLQNSVTIDKASSFLMLANDYGDRYLRTIVLELISLNERLFKSYIFENMTLKTRLLWFGTAEISQESKEITLESMVKKISVLKYNEDSIVSYGLGLTLDSSDEQKSLDEQNVSPIRNVVPDEIIPLDELNVVAGCLKETHTNTGNSSSETKDTISCEMNLSRMQLIKQDLPLKKIFSSDPNLNEERKVSEQVLKEHPVNVQIQCQDEEIKSPKSYASPNKNEIKENLSPTTCETNNTQKSSKEKKVDEMAPVLKACSEKLDELNKALDELKKTKLQSDSVLTEPSSEVIEVTASMKESSENILEKTSTDELS